MFVFTLNILGLFAGGGSGGDGFWNDYINFPGFEVWRFVNLAIFVGILIYILKKPLSAAFKAKRESIRAELIKAEEEKKAALAKLTEVETRIAGSQTEIDTINAEAKREIDEEKSRLAAQAEIESAKLREQAAGEIVRIGQVAKLELRRFGVNESLRLAEEKLRADITPQVDEKLIRSGIQAIGEVN